MLAKRTNFTSRKAWLPKSVRNQDSHRLTEAEVVPVSRPALSQMFKGALPGETERCEVLWSHMRKLEEAVFWPVCVLTVH